MTIINQENRENLCESCLVGGIKRPATTKSKNPDWSGYDLCEECAAELNNRPFPLEFRGEE